MMFATLVMYLAQTENLRNSLFANDAVQLYTLQTQLPSLVPVRRQPCTTTITLEHSYFVRWSNEMFAVSLSVPVANDTGVIMWSDNPDDTNQICSTYLIRTELGTNCC